MGSRAHRTVSLGKFLRRVRQEAAKALGAMGERGAEHAPALAAALRDGDEYVLGTGAPRQ